jgi:hypothetical protein
MRVLTVLTVIGILVAGSAVFVSNHPRAIAACLSNCD